MLYCCTIISFLFPKTNSSYSTSNAVLSEVCSPLQQQRTPASGRLTSRLSLLARTFTWQLLQPQSLALLAHNTMAARPFKRQWAIWVCRHSLSHNHTTHLFAQLHAIKSQHLISNRDSLPRPIQTSAYVSFFLLSNAH